MAISYNKETWKSTDTFNENTSNKWEQGIADAIDGVNEVNNDLHGQNVPLNLGTLVANSYVTVEGDIASYNNWKRTDYIDVSGLTSLIPSKGTGSDSDKYNCFYDASKRFISYFYVTANQKVSVPSNAKYVIFSNTGSVMNELTVSYDGIVENFREVNANIQDLEERALPSNFRIYNVPSSQNTQVNITINGLWTNNSVSCIFLSRHGVISFVIECLNGEKQTYTVNYKDLGATGMDVTANGNTISIDRSQWNFGRLIITTSDDYNFDATVTH